LYDHTHTPAATQRHAHAIADRSPMLSLAGVSGAAFVMMSCKAPPPVPLRPAIGKGLLRVDTTLVLSLGQSRRPPHSARGASMLAHDGSTSTPTATATALALAMVLAFAPVGDAQAAVGVCEGMPPLRSIGCQRAAEAKTEQRSAMEAELAAIQASRKAAEAELKAAQDASKSAKAKVGGGGGKVHQTPKQRAQLQRLDTQQEVKALKARVATLEKERHQTISSNRETDTRVQSSEFLRANKTGETDTAVLKSFITGLLCSILFGYALVGVGIPGPDAAVIQIVTYWLTYLVFDLPIP